MSQLLLGDALHKASTYFETKGCESPRLSAELLLAAALHTDRLHLYMDFHRPMIASEVEAYREFVRRRGIGEPVAYILGRKEFFSLDFQVGKGVLIPRPDTEILVQAALDLMNSVARENVRVLEIGVGSGIISVILASTRPDAVIVATDFSGVALDWAKRNAEFHGVSDRITFYRADLIAPISETTNADDLQREIEEGFDIIVSNPPYIPTGDIPGLQWEVRDWEPKEALDGGPDGLDVLRNIIRCASPVLHRPDGVFAFEVGEGQAGRILSEFGEDWLVEARPDLSERERVVIMRPGA